MNIIQRIRLWWSGQRRTRPGKRGRVYTRRDEEPSGKMSAESKGSASISAVVTRRDGTQENLGKVSEGEL